MDKTLEMNPLFYLSLVLNLSFSLSLFPCGFLFKLNFDDGYQNFHPGAGRFFGFGVV